MCVTSPPYFGLRDYGHDGQIGLEQTPEQYIAAMVEVFRCGYDEALQEADVGADPGVRGPIGSGVLPCQAREKFSRVRATRAGDVVQVDTGAE